MFCDLYCLEPGQEQKPHRHEGADKIYYIIEGEGLFRVGDREQRCGPETAVFAPSGSDHGVHNPGPGRMTLLVFMAPNPNY
jgi:mannose-6-phosphate isomerase-like protein (cupin superfamily)